VSLVWQYSTDRAQYRAPFDGGEYVVSLYTFGVAHYGHRIGRTSTRQRAWRIDFIRKGEVNALAVAMRSLPFPPRIWYLDPEGAKAAAEEHAREVEKLLCVDRTRKRLLDAAKR
jgi:hypothetical protein